MSRFNTVKEKGRTKTVNLAGGEAYKQSPELQLVSTLLTSFAQDQFYKTGDTTVSEIGAMIDALKDKKFAAQAAIYARNEFGMRSITHVTAAEIAARVKGESWTKNFIDKVVYRVDDMLEIVSYYMAQHGKPIPNSIKKGLRTAFGRFDGYQLAKYKSAGSEFSLVDLVNLVHPTPNEKNAEALTKLMKGELKRTGTWEDKMTKVGQTAENKKDKQEMKAQVWSEMIAEKKLGYFALLKNLRNILADADEQTVEAACSMLVDRKQIKKSLVLPFRFLTAFKELQKVSGSAKVLKAIAQAAEISLDNVPKLPGKTLVALDVSGSMRSANAKMNYSIVEIAAQFATVLVKANEADLIMFEGNAKYFNLSPTVDLMSGIQLLSRMDGGSTNFHAIFETADKAYDRIIILSDMQAWVGYYSPHETFNTYCQRVGQRPKVYSFDLAGYSTMQFPEQQVCALAGFSDKIFDIMALLETDPKALVNKIKQIEI